MVWTADSRAVAAPAPPRRRRSWVTMPSLLGRPTSERSRGRPSKVPPPALGSGPSLDEQLEQLEQLSDSNKKPRVDSKPVAPRRARSRSAASPMTQAVVSVLPVKARRYSGTV